MIVVSVCLPSDTLCPYLLSYWGFSDLGSGVSPLSCLPLQCHSAAARHSITNWKILKEMGIPDHLTCLLRKLYAGQEATVRTEHRTADWFQIGKGVHQGCILSPCLFNLYAEYIVRNGGQNDAQLGEISIT